MQLVPVNYQGFQTTEAIFDPAWVMDPLKSFRMTRKGWGEFFGAKQPQKYIDKLAERYPDLPKGVTIIVTVTEDYNWKGHSAVTVTGQCSIEKVSERTREITVMTLDVWEGYQYAIESTLPKAKEFLRKFPIFIKAIMTKALRPDSVLSEIARKSPYSLGRRQAILQISKETGECSATIYRRVRRIVDGKPIYENCPTMRKGYIHTKHRDVVAEVFRLVSEGIKIKEVAEITGIPWQTIYRWRRYLN